GRLRTHPALAARRAVAGRNGGQAGQHVPADVLPALRDRSVRAGLPGLRGLPHSRRAQRSGLQPVRGHPVLREQLPVPRAEVQLVQLHVGHAAGPAAESRRDCAPARRDGEGHDVRPAHRGGQGRRAGGRSHGQGRGHADGLSADLPDPGDHLRQPQGRRRPRVEALRFAPRLSRAGRAGDDAGGDVPEEGGPGRARGRARQGRPLMSAPPAHSATAPAQVTWADVNRDVIRTVGMPGDRYFAWMCLVALTLACGVAAWAWQIYVGIGAAGKRTPQMWAMYITTFVFWIGIGHAGTLISAVLYLFRARWRTSIYRGAEAMTVFAVMTAGLFPLIHAGRMWFAYWLMPYPNQRYLWPNFKSPLVWDVFAISTYLTISVVFFLVGLVPDIAALRDQSTGIRKQIYTVMSLGWEGSDSQWRHYRRASGIFAAISTPLVVSGHSAVSFDFAMALVPGWHSTLFPPFFVDGAIFSGFAMVLVLLLPMRYFFNWYPYITDRHLDAMAKLILVTSLVLTYFYTCEVFTAWYSGDHFERASVFAKATKQYAWAYWLTYFCNSVVPLVLFSKKARIN